MLAKRYKSMISQNNRKGSPLPASLRERLARHDDRDVLRATGLSPAAYWRARGGGDVHGGTALRIERALDELEAEHTTAV
jgi:hypothetical protein